MSSSQIEKAARFRALHDRPGPFVIPNPWDVASTRILEGIGFEAVATSSAASACAVGRRDGELTREEVLGHARTKSKRRLTGVASLGMVGAQRCAQSDQRA